jgi:hypothetical protein
VKAVASDALPVAERSEKESVPAGVLGSSASAARTRATSVPIGERLGTSVGPAAAAAAALVVVGATRIGALFAATVRAGAAQHAIGFARVQSSSAKGSAHGATGVAPTTAPQTRVS